MSEENKENEEIVELDNEIKTENINVPRETSRCSLVKATISRYLQRVYSSISSRVLSKDL